MNTKTLNSIWKPKPGVIEELSHWLQANDEAIGNADLAVRVLEDFVLTDANSLRDVYERREKYASWASVGLYTLGWGLGLVGRLYGGRDVAAGG